MPSPNSDVARRHPIDRVGESIRRGIDLIPAEFRKEFDGMLTSDSIRVASATLILWASSHAVGVGAVADGVLLVVGFATMGLNVLVGVDHLAQFAHRSISAETPDDIEAAAHHFAKAFEIFGMTMVELLLAGRANGGNAATRLPKPTARPATALIPQQIAAAAAEIGTVTSRAGTMVVNGYDLVTDFWNIAEFIGTIEVVRERRMTERMVEAYRGWARDAAAYAFAPLARLQSPSVGNGSQRDLLMSYVEESTRLAWCRLAACGLDRHIHGLCVVRRRHRLLITTRPGSGRPIGRFIAAGRHFVVCE